MKSIQECLKIVKLPNDWIWSTIEDLISPNGIFLDGDWVESKDQDPNGEVRLIQLADIGDAIFKNKSNRFLTYRKAIELSCTFLEQGDILIARLPEPLGRACIFPLSGANKYVTAVDVCIVRPKNSYINNSYLLYSINAPQARANIEKLKTGTTRKRISRSNLAKILFPIPPLPEQRAIVARIEELFSRLDKGVETLQKVKEQLKVYRQAVLKWAFEGKLTAEWRKSKAAKSCGSTTTAEELLHQIKAERERHYQQKLAEWQKAVEEWEAKGKPGKKPAKPQKPKELPIFTYTEIAKLPKLPDNWLWIKIGQISNVGTGLTPLKSNERYYRNGNIPWVTSGALNNWYVTRPSGYITKIALEKTKLKIYPKHTLLIAMYGEGKTRGKCSELMFDATINQAIAAIVLRGTAEKTRKFLKWFLQKNYDDIRRKSSGGVQPNLNLGIIENIAIPFCSIEEQNQIVQEIESRLSVADKLEQIIDETLQKAEALRQSILKKAFEGRLLSEAEREALKSDPEWEPAEKLLERIKAEKEKQETKNNKKKRK